MSDLFISYASEDRERVLQFVHALEACEWSVFWDRKIPFGQTWRQVIGSELDQARCVIVLWSSNSIASLWVQEEAEEAKRRNILIPFLIDDVQPPLGFRSIQTANLSGWEGDPSSPRFAGVLRDINRVLAVAPEKPTIRPQPTPLFRLRPGAIMVIAIAWSLSWVIVEVLFRFLGPGPPLGWFLAWALSGGLGGSIAAAVTCRALRITASGGKTALVVVGWSGACAAQWALVEPIGAVSSGALAGLVCGAILGAALRAIVPLFNWTRVASMGLGWSVAGAIGWGILPRMASFFLPQFGDPAGFYVNSAVGGAIAGLVGGAVSVWLLKGTESVPD